MNAQDRIRERVEQFVEELNELFRKAAWEAVSSSLNGSGSTSTTTTRRPGRAALPRTIATPRVARAAAAAEKLNSSKGNGAKRLPEELDQVVQELYDYIALNEGEGIESIAKGLSRSSKELSLPMKKLLSSQRVEKRGHKRSTKYYAV